MAGAPQAEAAQRVSAPLGGMGRLAGDVCKQSGLNPRMCLKRCFRRRATLNIGGHHPLQITAQGVLSSYNKVT